MGAGVGGEVDEELVGFQQVGQVGPLGEVPASAAGVVAAGDVLTALGGDDVGTQLVEQVVVRVGATVGLQRPETGQHSNADQAA